MASNYKREKFINLSNSKMSEVCCMYKTMAEQAKKSRKQRPNSGRKKMVSQDVKIEVRQVELRLARIRLQHRVCH